MPTTKPRINLSVPRDMNLILQKLAHRNRRPIATLALQLLERALEIEEDVMLDRVAIARDKKGVRFASHARAWRC